jgi:hypothetical protein
MPKIETLEDAFQSIEENGQVNNLPVAAIEFIQKHPPSDIIDEQISQAIIHANNDQTYKNLVINRDYTTPLFYAIAAETHLTEKITKAVIHYATHPEYNDFEILKEQLTYLAGKLCEAFPDNVPGRMFDVLERQVKRNMPHPYPILLDAVFFLDKEKYSERLINLLYYAENLDYCIAPYINILAEIGFDEALPKIKALNVNYKLSNSDIEYSIFKLKGGPGANKFIGPYSSYRSHWKKFYSN